MKYRLHDCMKRLRKHFMVAIGEPGLEST
jgi:hypothetical protein